MLLKLIFKHGDLSLLESLLKHEELKSFDWNGVIDQKMTVLMLVCKSQNQAKSVELAKILINEKSVEIAKRNDVGITAVFQAMIFKNFEMVKLFLDEYEEKFAPESNSFCTKPHALQMPKTHESMEFHWLWIIFLVRSQLLPENSNTRLFFLSCRSPV